ncbi:putative disease resistance protein RGA3 [Cryptomeria japonica]|uniref:putative disease resistance protein RGA3 n=1 Tax=Cryptomeria japonica TaxID=3369 RepID=UPI0027DAA2BD|nr:putative disease resistance protein RGA3 [Cryptomeria japonica]
MEVVIAQAVVDKLSGIVAQKVSEEIALVCNFKEDFEWLNANSTIISGCLASANSQAVQEKPVKTWLHHVQDVVWDAEDIVEECAVRPIYTSSVTQSCVCNPDELIFRYRMAKRIQEVKKRIRSVMESGQQLELFQARLHQPSSSAAGEAARKENRRLPFDSHPVGIEPKLKSLRLMIDQSTVPVIAVVGMAGAGKTFLVRNVFERIDQGYEYKIWFSISQSYTVRQLQMDLASYTNEIDKQNLNDLSENRRAELIHGALQGKKSLIVLDDVWRAASENNIIERLGLPIAPESQCKVVVTSRDRKICEKLRSLLYNVELLSEEESWQLFCAHAFGGEPPVYLQEIAPKVSQRCGNLPLALKIIGASLARCTEIREWDSKVDQLPEFSGPNSDAVTHIFKLSYDSLPPTLKLCFSYVSFFPEDERIDAEYLINLWIAEGFIPQGEDQWAVAWHYLDQLANLCLLEVEEDEYLVKHCKIHDLVLDLAIDISKEHQCKFSVDDDFRSARRILLRKKEIENKDIVKGRASCPKSLRTLSLYETPIEIIEKKFVSPMRLLRVLDLSKTQISTLPPCVGKLKILKLLNLSRTGTKKVPECVRSLKSHLFLDLSHCGLESLPNWINKLKCLQHLNIIGCKGDLLSQMPKGISELVALRVLRSNNLKLSVTEDGLLKLEDVAKLTCLQELSIEVKHAVEDGTFAQQLEMRHLSVKSTLSSASAQPPNLSRMRHLQTLKLKKFAVPNWVFALHDLAHLELANCECRNYPELQALPHLKKLILDGNRSCKNLPKGFGKPSGFPKLRFLHIQNFSHLEELPDLEDRAMAVLEEFYVGFCPRVSKVPEGLEWLTKLRKVYYTGDRTDGLNKSRKIWDEFRQNIEDENGPRVKIILTII